MQKFNYDMIAKGTFKIEVQYGEAKLIPFVNKKGINFASPYCIIYRGIDLFEKKWDKSFTVDFIIDFIALKI